MTHGEIELNASYIRMCCPSALRDTILHEIAHALSPLNERHGERWQAKCREIGALPRWNKTDKMVRDETWWNEYRELNTQNSRETMPQFHLEHSKSFAE